MRLVVVVIKTLFFIIMGVCILPFLIDEISAQTFDVTKLQDTDDHTIGGIVRQQESGNVVGTVLGRQGTWFHSMTCNDMTVYSQFPQSSNPFQVEQALYSSTGDDLLTGFQGIIYSMQSQTDGIITQKFYDQGHYHRLPYLVDGIPQMF